MAKINMLAVGAFWRGLINKLHFWDGVLFGGLIGRGSFQGAFSRNYGVLVSVCIPVVVYKIRTCHVWLFGSDPAYLPLIRKVIRYFPVVLLFYLRDKKT